MYEQRSSEWFEQRRGKFTSSCIPDLMGIKGIGKTGESLAFKKACEIVMGLDQDDDYVSFDMQRGIDLEPLAFENFKESAKVDFLNVENCGFFELNKNEGGTPDGVVNQILPLEIKCPKRDKYLRFIIDEVLETDHYYQIQHQMRVLGSGWAYYYNFIIHNGKPMGHTIIVQRNQELINLMGLRINEAIEIRDGFVNMLKSKL